MRSDRTYVTYAIETPLALEDAAEAIAGEQSTGTFVAVPGETADLRARFRATVESVTPLGDTRDPSLAGARTPADGTYRRGEIVVSFPVAATGPSLPTLLATVAGNLFELRELSGLRLRDIHYADAFRDAYPGAAFGIDGTRRLAGAPSGPLVGTIIKPSVGLDPGQTAALVDELVTAGIDFIKDDELQANGPHCPLHERVAAVMPVIERHADWTGKRVMYAFNITDDIDAMCRHHDTVAGAGGTCVMVSVNSMGAAGVAHLRERARLPIHAHRNGWGMYTRHPSLGMDFRFYQKIWRLAGVDHLHVNALDNKFTEPNDSVVESIGACLAPMWDGYPLMPVVSSGQWGGQAPETYARTGTTDLMYLAGGGIMAHPGGPGAGVVAIRQAWDAAISGIDLHEHARDHVELRQSIETFGVPR
jgi:ribulose-bisphosphate carboxylase large chain